MSFNGAAYATFTVNGDVLGARMDRTAVTFAPLTGAAGRRPRRRRAGVGSGRSRVAISADGTGIAVWGEAGHVYARRMFDASPSTAVLDLTLPDLEGHAGRRRRRAVRRHRGRLVVRLGRVPRGRSPTAPATQRAGIGVRLRGSRIDPPRVAFDGLGWGGGTPRSPAIDLNGKGERRRDRRDGRPARRCRRSSRTTSRTRRARIGGSGTPAQPVGAVAETYDRAVGWSAPATAPSTASSTTTSPRRRLVPGPSPDALLTNPALGPSTRPAGFDVAGDRTGDFAFAFVQGTRRRQRRLVVASYDRLPGAFAI